MFLSRKCGWRSPRSRRADGFNGAGMFLSRKWSYAGNYIRGSVASMGPGCFYPGNSPEETSAHPQFQLQWGRDVSIPEINQLPYLFTFNSKLQWGRDVSIPEMPGGTVAGVLLSGFNGAGMFLSRKCVEPFW